MQGVDIKTSLSILFKLTLGWDHGVGPWGETYYIP